MLSVMSQHVPNLYKAAVAGSQASTFASGVPVPEAWSPSTSIDGVQPAPLPNVGTRSYTILKEVGDGSFGTVWLADWHSPLS
jgi:hypothetical protein